MKKKKLMETRGFLKVAIVVIVAIAIIIPGSANIGILKSENKTSTTNNFQLNSHLMTRSEINKFKKIVGVYDSNKNYNIMYNGFCTGLTPPTDEEWESMIGNVYIVDNVKSSSRELPLSLDHSTELYFPYPDAQGGSSCAAWSVAYYQNGYMQAVDHGWDQASAGNTSQLMSPVWTYTKCNYGTDIGSSLYGNARVISTVGNCRDSLMPYDEFDWGDEDAWRDAPEYRCVNIYQMYDFDADTITTIKEELNNGHLVSMVLNSSSYGGLVDSGDDIINSTDNLVGSTHANTIVGYDDTLVDPGSGEIGCFKIVNSWGHEWGPNNDGTYWMTYDAFLELTYPILWFDDLYQHTVNNPKLLGVWELNPAGNRDASIELGIGSYPDINPRTPDWDGHTEQMHDFPEFMCLDITEFFDDWDYGITNFYLEMGSSAVPSTITSYKTEYYEGGYIPGSPSQTSGESPDTPKTSPGYVTVSFSQGPDAPVISSNTHPDEDQWYSNNNPEFTWTIPYDPSGINGYSYVLTDSPSTIPDTLIDTTDTSTSYTDLSNGVHYFHVRAVNGESVGGCTDHYRVKIYFLSGNEIFVDDDALPGGDGSLNNPFQNIAEGITNVDDGGTVVVFEGVYKGENNRNLQFNDPDKIITLLGLVPTDTIIDLEQSDKDGLNLYEANNPTIDGFTITNSNSYYYAVSAGSYGEATIKNCIFRDNANTAIHLGSVDSTNLIFINCVINNNTCDNGNGGGIHHAKGDLTVINCKITNNSAKGSGTGNGGGIYHCNDDLNPLIIIDSEINNNTADTNGGGICCHGGVNITIINSDINNNTANGLKGGGIFYLRDESGSSLTVNHSRVIGNIADDGGGITCVGYGEEAWLNITHSIISKNIAYDIGGGIFIGVPVSKSTDNSKERFDEKQNDREEEIYILIKNCIITDNHAFEGGGIFVIDHYVKLQECTIANNKVEGCGSSGSGLYIIRGSTEVTLDNCIVWGNIPQCGQINGAAKISFSDIEFGWGGEGNINENPRFVDSESGDYHIKYNSPCIDMGDPNFMPGPDKFDIDDEPRVVDGRDDGTERIDMGADEYYFKGWPMFHHDPLNTGFTTSYGSSTSDKLWNSSQLGLWVESSPAVVNERMYVGATIGYTDGGPEGMIYCFDANPFDGEDEGNPDPLDVEYDIIWQTPLPKSPSYSSPAVSDGKVYIGSTDGNLYCLDASDDSIGEILWICPLGSHIYSSPTVFDGYVYIGSRSNKVHCINAETGEEEWSFDTDDGVTSTPAVSDGKVYVGSWDGKMYCLDATNGNQIWNFTTLDMISYSSPAVVDGKVYFGSWDNNTYCVDALDGDLIWSFTTDDKILSSPAVVDGRVYVGSFDNKIYCLDAEGNPDTETTTELWNYTTGDRVFSSLAVADGKVYGGSRDGIFYCLNAENGNKIWDYTTTGEFHFSGFGSSPAVVDGKVYIPSTNGRVYCFRENHFPYFVSDPYPYDEDIDVDINQDLSWNGGDPDWDDTVMYSIAFGTDPSDLNCFWDDEYHPCYGETGPHPATMKRISFDPGELSYGMTYYWKIMAEDNHGKGTIGPTWSFTTRYPSDFVTFDLNYPPDEGNDIELNPELNVTVTFDDSILDVLDLLFMTPDANIASTSHDISTSKFTSLGSVYPVDLDDDGDLDVLGAVDDGIIAWWENNGDKTFGPMQSIYEYIYFGGACDVSAADFDSDGLIDVLGAAHWDGGSEIVWWRNIGSEGNPAFDPDESMVIADIDCGEHDHYCSIHVVDIDNDENIDVLGAIGDKIVLFRNDGNGGFINFTIDSTFFGAFDVYATDIDNNGFIDVLGAASRSGEDEDGYEVGEIAYWLNNGDGGFGGRIVIEDGFSSVYFECGLPGAIYAADVDDDGDVDILTAIQYYEDPGCGEIAWWENNGEMGADLEFTKHSINNSEDEYSTSSIYAADIDSDGDIDVLTAGVKPGDWSKAETTWWENNGEMGADLEFTNHNIDSDDGYDVYAVDIDSDGDIDILEGKRQEEIVWWENDQAIGQDFDIVSGSNALYEWEDLEAGTRYDWRVIAQTDVYGVVGRGPLWWFETESFKYVFKH